MPRLPTSTLFPYTTLFRSCTPDLDRADLRLHLRVQARLVPDLQLLRLLQLRGRLRRAGPVGIPPGPALADLRDPRSEEHTSELQSRFDLVCRLLLEKKKRT